MAAENLNNLLMILAIISSLAFGLIIRFDKRQIYQIYPWLSELLCLISLFLLTYFWLDFWPGGSGNYLVVCLYLSSGLSLLPLLFLYASKQSGISHRHSRLWLHFLPAATACLGLTIGFFILSDESINYLTSGTVFFPYPDFFPSFFRLFLLIFNDLAFLIQTIVYLVILLIHVNRSLSLPKYQNKPEIQIRLIRVRFQLVILSVYATGMYIAEYLITNLSDEAFDMLFLLVGIFLIGSLAYPVFAGSNSKLIALNNSIFEANVIRVIQSRSDILSPSETKRLISELEELMKQDWYLDPDCSLNSLSERLHTNRNYLSILFNDYLNEGYHSYINRLRIIRATEILKQEQALIYSIEGVSQMVGFKSKSSFIKHFRDYTGQTPGQFRLKKSGKGEDQTATG